MTEPAQRRGGIAPKRIVGYCDPLSVTPGEEIRFFLSSDPGLGEFQADLVRPRAGGPGWEDAGPDCTQVKSELEGTYPARQQDVHPGSFGLIGTAGQLAGLGQVTIVVLVQPTFRAPAPQVILSVGDPWAGPGMAVLLDAELRPALATGADPHHPLTCPAPLGLGAWSVVAATLGGGAPPVLYAGPFDGDDAAWVSVTGPDPVPAETLAAAALVLGAVRSPGSGVTRLPFTGRLEAPAILPGAVGRAGLRAVVSADPAQPPADAIAAWDFSAGIDGWGITDRGPHAWHGGFHNLPMRAVRGARWSGLTSDWREAPAEYAAVHFLADAIEDCGWSADFSLTIPAGTPSGFYAARITSGDEREFIPFFIRPAGGATASVLLIAPTATYASYGNSRFWWENPIQEMVQDRLVELGAEDRYLIDHPELGASSYDCHLDGTDVCYVSRRRPNLNMRPGHVRREGYTCDLYLVAWLDRLGISYDVVTDEDVHAAGRDLLEQYPVVMTGTHPEYMSTRMFDALAGWVKAGGRLMYMGGNGFSMNVGYSAERPWIMENRRVDLWECGPDAARSEALNSTDGLRGGWFSASGRQPADLTGVESATMGFDHSYPYVLGAAAARPEAAFVFAGVTGTVIGDYGSLGGGVVGQEWDNAAGHTFGAGHLILASSRDHTLIPPMFGALRPDYHADLVLYFNGAGTVFSVSSMAWAGALGHRDYDNDIARISQNVLRRFLDPAPLARPESNPGDPA